MRGIGRITSVWAVIVLLLLTVAGCGGGAQPSETDKSPSAAGDATTDGDGSPASPGGQQPGSPGGSKTSQESDDDGSSARDDDAKGERGEERNGSRDSSSPDSGAGVGGNASGGEGSSSGDFKVPGGDNSIQESGKEASDPERAQASEVLEAYMRARAAEDKRTVCANLSEEAIEQLKDFAQAVEGVNRSDGCAAIFTAIDEQTPHSSRRNTMSGPIGSLRVKGDHAFALFHGNDGIDYAIQMVDEGDGWKVNALVPYAIS